MGLAVGSTGVVSVGVGRRGKVLVRWRVSRMSLRAASTFGGSVGVGGAAGGSALSLRWGWGAGGGGVRSSVSTLNVKREFYLGFISNSNVSKLLLA